MSTALRTPSQSFHHLRGSHNKYTTPEKLVRVQANSGVKCTPISKSIGSNNRLRSETAETIAKVREQQKLFEYIQELEQKLSRLESVSYLDSTPQQQELEKRIIQLLNENFRLNQELNQNLKLNSEFEQLKQLVFEQQAKILQQSQEIDMWQQRYKKLQKEYESVNQQCNGLTFSLRKHCSFSEYFQSEKQK